MKIGGDGIVGCIGGTFVSGNGALAGAAFEPVVAVDVDGCVVVVVVGAPSRSDAAPAGALGLGVMVPVPFAPAVVGNEFVVMPSVAAVCASRSPVAGRLAAAWNARIALRVGAESVPSIAPW